MKKRKEGSEILREQTGRREGRKKKKKKGGKKKKLGGNKFKGKI